MKLILITLLFSTLLGQAFAGNNKVDTIYSGDTTIIRYFDNNGELALENYVKDDELLAYKEWFFTEEGYGYFWHNTGVKKDYLLFEYSHENVLAAYCQFINNKMEGTAFQYYPNGSIKCECHFHLGKIDSIQKMFYQSRALEVVANCKNGKEEGLYTYFHENGNIWSEIFYKNGIPFTVISNFNSSGIPVEKGNLLYGEGTRNVYDNDGTLIEIEYYKKGKLKKVEKLILPE